MENRDLLPCPFCGSNAIIECPEINSFGCSNCGSRGPNNDIYIWWNTREHPSGGLVALDEEEVKKVVFDNFAVLWDDADDCANTESIAKAICQRFGQPKIKLPARKEAKAGYNDSQIYFISGYNISLDDISKLNSTEG